MKEIDIKAKREKEQKKYEEYKKSKNKIEKLNERYQELQMEEVYEEKKRNGEGNVNFRMINEASEVVLQSDKRWKDLGFIHRTKEEIKEELKKQMNSRDRRETKKFDRYEARHAILLHKRASTEEVIVNEIKVDLNHSQKEEVEEKDRLIKASSTSDGENEFNYENVTKEIDEMSDNCSSSSNTSNEKGVVVVTQETPTKRRRPVDNPYAQENKTKIGKNEYKGWKTVIAQTKPSSLEENEKKRSKTITKDIGNKEVNKSENDNTNAEKGKVNSKKRTTYSNIVKTTAKYEEQSENSKNELIVSECNNSVRVKFYFHALPSENESSIDFITTMLIHLSECSQMIDPKAGLLTWEECGEKLLNAKGARLLNKEMIQKYINIPGNPSKLVVGRTYYQVGI